MRSRLAVLRFLAILVLLPAIAAAQSRAIARPVLNMYSSATLDADVVSQAIYATNVTVLEEKDGWTRIRTPDDYTGWVETSGLFGRAEQAYAAGTDVVQVQSLFAHLYREDSVTKHAPLLTVPFETRLQVDTTAPKTERWLGVILPDGRRARIQNADVARGGRTMGVVETIALAKRFIGLPYTWGGTSSYGFDCSGFTQMLMRQRGYMMPRDASPQSRWDRSEDVQRAELRPGDLLYFGSSRERVTHTGMFIGDGLFINSTTHETPTVRIDNLNDEYWTRLLVAARRVKQ